MKTQRLILNPCLIVAVLFVLAGSVVPAMAADANSKHMISFKAGSAGWGSSSANAGGEKNVLTQKNTPGISAESPKVNTGEKTAWKDNKKWGPKSWRFWTCIAAAIIVIALVTTAVVFSGGMAAPVIAEIVEQPLVFIGIVGGVPIFA